MTLLNIYDELYLLLIDVFGTAASNSIVDITCQVTATIGTLFLVALPFIIVYRILKLFLGR